NIEGGTAPYTMIVNGLPLSEFSVSLPGPSSVQLLINDQQNCGVSSTIVIPNHNISLLEIPEQDSISCSNTSVQIVGVAVSPEQNTLNNWEYLASNANWEALQYTELNPLVIQSGVYRVTVTDSISGCSATTTVEIDESESGFIDLTEIRFPNIITPNGDSDNDVWMPFLKRNTSLVLPSIMDTYELKIFNRWGEQVFDSSTGSGRYWNADGYGEGVYYYELYYRIECGGVQEGRRSGHFQIIR
ncbi:MAG: gliding motility-associated C-terminal domain-containing protein, partial [Flavobacteriales bacterium]